MSFSRTGSLGRGWRTCISKTPGVLLLLVWEPHLKFISEAWPG